jgi:hypothetical protein
MNTPKLVPLPNKNFLDETTLRKAPQMAAQIGVSPDKLDEDRLSGFLLPGSWFQPTSRLILYVVPLIIDRYVNSNDDEAHRRAIAWWHSQLPSNCAKK